MFLVGGGILTHGVPAAHHQIETWTQQAATTFGGFGEALVPMLVNGVAGVLAGALALAAWMLVRRISGR
jgi:predicted DNA repair protein MutK